MKLWPFKVSPSPSDKPVIVVRYKGEEKKFSAKEISSMVLAKVKELLAFSFDCNSCCSLDWRLSPWSLSLSLSLSLSPLVEH